MTQQYKETSKKSVHLIHTAISQQNLDLPTSLYEGVQKRAFICYTAVIFFSIICKLSAVCLIFSLGLQSDSH